MAGFSEQPSFGASRAVFVGGFWEHLGGWVFGLGAGVVARGAESV